jgi:hypothetical protein
MRKTPVPGSGKLTQVQEKVQERKLVAADTLGDKNCEAAAALSTRGAAAAADAKADVDDAPSSILARSFCRADVCSAKTEDGGAGRAVEGNGKRARMAGAGGADGGSSYARALPSLRNICRASFARDCGSAILSSDASSEEDEDEEEEEEREAEEPEGGLFRCRIRSPFRECLLFDFFFFCFFFFFFFLFLLLLLLPPPPSSLPLLLESQASRTLKPASAPSS